MTPFFWAILLHCVPWICFPSIHCFPPVLSDDPQEVWDAACSGWSTSFGRPESMQMYEGGAWKNEIRTDQCAERRIKLQFQGVGAHPCLLERRNGLARGIDNRPIEDGRSASRQIFAITQRCLKAMISAGGFSAYQMVFGSNPVDPSRREDNDADLMFTRDASLAGQFAQQWKLRTHAHEAALKEVANGKLPRLVAYNRPFNCTDVNVGDSSLFHKAQNHKSSPRRRGPAKIPDTDETSRRQTLKVGRYCVRKRPFE